jgi:hypothetical protein
MREKGTSVISGGAFFFASKEHWLLYFREMTPDIFHPLMVF